jgi:hypothetical protein
MSDECVGFHIPNAFDKCAGHERNAGYKMLFQTVYVMQYATMPMNIIIVSLTCAIR